jgi:hypothetical protein
MPLTAPAMYTFEHTVRQFNNLLDDDWVIESFYGDIGNVYARISDNPNNLIKVAEFGRKLTEDITDNYEKARAIFDWFEENFIYNFSWLDELDAVMALQWRIHFHEWGEKYDAFLNGPTGNRADLLYENFLNQTGICDDYAALFRLMAVAAGIPTELVYGGSTDGESHVWNIFWYDKEARWVLVDATWGIFDMGIEEFSALGAHLVYYRPEHDNIYYNFSAFIDSPEVMMHRGERRYTELDALYILKSELELLELTERQQARYDLNGDGVINAEDALIILKILVGLPV